MYSSIQLREINVAHLQSSGGEGILGRNPAEVRVHKQVDKNLVPRLLASYCKDLCDCFKHLVKKKSFPATTANVEKEMLNFSHETAGKAEILPVFTHVLRTLQSIFSGFHGKLFSVLLQGCTHVFSFLRECKNHRVK